MGKTATGDARDVSGHYTDNAQGNRIVLEGFCAVVHDQQVHATPAAFIRADDAVVNGPVNFREALAGGAVDIFDACAVGLTNVQELALHGCVIVGNHSSIEGFFPIGLS